MAYKESPVEGGAIERGLGCASVIPSAFIGVAGLADYAGPKGWLGFSEFLGWAVLCFGAGLGIGRLLSQIRHSGPRRYGAIPLAVVAVAAFTYLPYWLGFDAPTVAKVAFTTTLQIVGSLTPIAWVIAAVLADSRQRY
jgi:hypothetical protein